LKWPGWLSGFYQHEILLEDFWLNKQFGGIFLEVMSEG